MSKFLFFFLVLSISFVDNVAYAVEEKETDRTQTLLDLANEEFKNTQRQLCKDLDTSLERLKISREKVQALTSDLERKRLAPGKRKRLQAERNDLSQSIIGLRALVQGTRKQLETNGQLLDNPVERKCSHYR